MVGEEHDFNSRPPHGGRPARRQAEPESTYTSTHDLHTEVDRGCRENRVYQEHFNSRPPHGGRPDIRGSHPRYPYFNSRPPHGGRRNATEAAKKAGYTSTHDLHTEVDCHDCPFCCVTGTSTHDLHTEVDRNWSATFDWMLTSTHDLHTEVDHVWTVIFAKSLILQLTTSTRRSTKAAGAARRYQNALQLTTSTRRST